MSVDNLNPVDQAYSLESTEEITINRGSTLTPEEEQSQFAQELLYTNLIDHIKLEYPEYTQAYASFGIADGLSRVAKLFRDLTPNNPELAASFAGIGVAVAKIGKEMAERHEAEEDMANIELTQEHIQSIKDRISIIDVDLPDHLKD